MLIYARIHFIGGRHEASCPKGRSMSLKAGNIWPARFAAGLALAMTSTILLWSDVVP